MTDSRPPPTDKDGVTECLKLLTANQLKVLGGLCRLRNFRQIGEENSFTAERARQLYVAICKKFRIAYLPKGRRHEYILNNVCVHLHDQTVHQALMAKPIPLSDLVEPDTQEVALVCSGMNDTTAVVYQFDREQQAPPPPKEEPFKRTFTVDVGAMHERARKAKEEEARNRQVKAGGSSSDTWIGAIAVLAVLIGVGYYVNSNSAPTQPPPTLTSVPVAQAAPAPVVKPLATAPPTAAVPTQVPQPTQPPAPTATLRPPPTAVANTPAGSTLRMGETWRSDGIWLTPVRFVFESTKGLCPSLGYLVLSLRNETGQFVVTNINSNDWTLADSRGRKLGVFSMFEFGSCIPLVMSTLSQDARYELNLSIAGDISQISGQPWLKLTIPKASRITDASWQLEIPH